MLRILILLAAMGYPRVSYAADLLSYVEGGCCIKGQQEWGGRGGGAICTKPRMKDRRQSGVLKELDAQVDVVLFKKY